MEKLARIKVLEWQPMVQEKFGKKYYINKIDGETIHYGLWLTTEDAMDYAGTITITELKNKTK